MLGRPAAAIGEGLGELEAQLTEFFADHYERLVRLASLICHSSASVEDANSASGKHLPGAGEAFSWQRRRTPVRRGRLAAVRIPALGRSISTRSLLRPI